MMSIRNRELLNMEELDQVTGGAEVFEYNHLKVTIPDGQSEPCDASKRFYFCGFLSTMKTIGNSLEDILNIYNNGDDPDFDAYVCSIMTYYWDKVSLK